MIDEEDITSLSLLEKLMRFKNGLTARATGGDFGGGDQAYFALRRELRKDTVLRSKLPPFVGQCTNLSEFWAFIRSEFATYEERRKFLRRAFAPMVEYLEETDGNQGVVPSSELLEQFDSTAVHAVWQKAIERLEHDPDGAITASKTLVETVCKHILDDEGVSYSESADLPNLWHLTAEKLSLSPKQHQDGNLKVVLGNCQSIISRLAAIRNIDGDAHGKGRRGGRPTTRTARLAVNLAGSMSSFLIEEWKAQHCD